MENNLSEEFVNTIWTFYQSNLSARTRNEYKNVIHNFVQVTGTDPLKLTKKAAEEYNTYLIKRVEANRLAYSTALMRISVMRSLCAYIRYQKNKQGSDYYNYFEDIILPDIDKNLKEESLPTADELNALLALAESKQDSKAFLIFSLAMKCGLTTSEISNLDIEHIVLDMTEHFCIQFPIKRKTSRIIRLPEDISTLLNEYIDKNLILSGPVFLNKRNTRLKVRDAERILNKYLQICEDSHLITHHFTFQDMRHAAFKYMLAGGASEEEAAQYGGISTKWLSRYRRIVNNENRQCGADYSIIHIAAAKNIKIDE